MLIVIIVATSVINHHWYTRYGQIIRIVSSPSCVHKTILAGVIIQIIIINIRSIHIIVVALCTAVSIVVVIIIPYLIINWANYFLWYISVIQYKIQLLIQRAIIPIRNSSVISFHLLIEFNVQSLK